MATHDVLQACGEIDSLTLLFRFHEYSATVNRVEMYQCSTSEAKKLPRSIPCQEVDITSIGVTIPHKSGWLEYLEDRKWHGNIRKLTGINYID